jgi:hypothetical protein
MELLMPNLVQMNYNRTKSTDYNNNIPVERTGSNYGLSTDFTGNFLQQTNVGFRFWL